MNFYEKYYCAYVTATEEQRQKARKHWLKCHSENLASKRTDLICFTAQILAMIDEAQSDIDSGYVLAM